MINAEEDPFSDVSNTTECKEITIADIKRLDEDVADYTDCDVNDDECCESLEEDSDDLTVLELAIAKIVETVNPAYFWQLLCPSCGKCFKSTALWQQHLDNVHFFYKFVMLSMELDMLGQSYSCKRCPAVFKCTEYRLIRQHAFTHMRYSNFYKCSLCDHLESSESAAAQHTRRHMEVHLLKAKVDRKILRSKKYVLNDNINYEKFLMYVCPECRTIARTWDAWQHHVATAHTLLEAQQLNFDTPPIDNAPEALACMRTTCKTCGQMLLSDNLLVCQQKHFLTHLCFRAFRCGLCDMHFNYSGEIKMHMVLLHCKNRATYEDAILPPNWRPGVINFDLHYKFFSAVGCKLTPHIHFNCPICNVEFKEVDQWTAHINANHDFFRPSHIALTMTTTAAGATRLRRPQRVRPYCLTCDRPLDAFRSFRCLWVEQLRHTAYPAFNCSICPEKFHTLRLLLNHFRVVHKRKGDTLDAEKFTKRRCKKRID